LLKQSSSGEEINQVNLRESMDELREKQRRMDLQKMPAEHRNNSSKALKGKGKKRSAQHNNEISKALKGAKLSVEHSIAIGLGTKISKAERAIEEGVQ